MRSKVAFTGPADLSLLRTDGDENMVRCTGKNNGSISASSNRVNALAWGLGSSL
jgi:hypothetical protein